MNQLGLYCRCVLGFVALVGAAPAGTETLIDGTDPANIRVLIDESVDAATEVVPVSGQPFDRAVRVEVREATQPVWAAQIISPAAASDVAAGDVIEGVFYLRAEPLAGVAPDVPGYFRSEAVGFEQLAWLGSNPGRRWEKRVFKAVADKSYAAGDLAVNLHLGVAAQRVEFGGLAVRVTRGGDEIGPTLAAVDNAIDSDLLDRLGPDARLIIPGHRPADLDGPGASPDASKSLVAVEGQTFTQAARVNVTQATDPVWDAQLTSPRTIGPIYKGDVLFGLIDVRAQSETESGGGQFTAWLQFPGDGTRGWTELRKLEGAPGPTWTRRFFATRATQDFAAGEVNLVLHLGVIPQTVDVANILLWNLGPDTDLQSLPKTELTYPGREPDAPWRAEAERRIDAFRKADLTVRVVDAHGVPVPGAQVDVELERLAFGLGTFTGNNTEDSEDHRFSQTVRKYFNRVTTACYAAEGWGWPNPQVKAKQIQELEWARRHGLPAKAHTVVWSRFDWSPKEYAENRADPARLRAEIEADIREVVAWTSEHGAESVDLLNEPVGFQEFDDVIGDPGLHASWFEIAHEAAPNLRLGINEHTILSAGGLNTVKHDAYAAIIRDLLDRGAPLHIIGMQGHIGEDFTPPEKIWEILDRFAAFGLPITVTELDINTEDEAVKADYLRDFVTAVFAHPATESVTLWGFWGGDIWIPQAQLWRADWSRTPAADAWVRLVTETFHTDSTATTGPGGEATVRGFHGWYHVTVRHDGLATHETIKLGPDGARLRVELDQP